MQQYLDLLEHDAHVWDEPSFGAPRLDRVVRSGLLHAELVARKPHDDHFISETCLKLGELFVVAPRLASVRRRVRYENDFSAMLAKVVDVAVDVLDVLEVEEGSDGGFRGGTEQRVEEPGHHLARVCAQPVRGRVWRWKSAKHVEKLGADGCGPPIRN